MADNFRPNKRQQARANERWGEVSTELSKLGPLNDFEVVTPFDVAIYNEAMKMFGSESRETSPTYQTMTAPSVNPPRPRALKIAYSRQAKKLVVKFRDNTWWEYNDIPVEMWNDLKVSNSTGRYLKHSGLDTHDDMGPFDPNQMTAETRVLFNEL